MHTAASHLRFRQDINQVCNMIHDGPWRVNRKVAAVLLRAFPDWLATDTRLRGVILESWGGGVERIDPSWPPAPAVALPAAIHEPRGSALLSIIECAKSRKVAEEWFGPFGSDWLAITLAARWGIEGSDVERIKWVHRREAQWRRIAADPLAHPEWASTGGGHEVGSGWLTLAAILDWVDYRDGGDGYVSHLPVNLAVRDAGKRDASRSVARRLQEELEAFASVSAPTRTVVLEDVQAAQWWLDLCGGEVPRSLVAGYLRSQPSMSGPTGASACLEAWLRENDPTWPGLDGPEGKRSAWYRLHAPRRRFLAGLLADIVAEFPVVVPAVAGWGALAALAGQSLGHEFEWRFPPPSSAPAPGE